MTTSPGENSDKSQRDLMLELTDNLLLDIISRELTSLASYRDALNISPESGIYRESMDTLLMAREILNHRIGLFQAK